MAIERPSQWIDDATKQRFTNRHIHDATGALDAITRMQVRVVTKQNDANIVLIQIEGDAEYVAGKREQLVGANVQKTRDVGDSRGHAGDRAGFPHHELWCEAFPRLADIANGAFDGFQ